MAPIYFYSCGKQEAILGAANAVPATESHEPPSLTSCVPLCGWPPTIPSSLLGMPRRLTYLAFTEGCLGKMGRWGIVHHDGPRKPDSGNGRMRKALIGAITLELHGLWFASRPSARSWSLWSASRHHATAMSVGEIHRLRGRRRSSELSFIILALSCTERGRATSRNDRGAEGIDSELNVTREKSGTFERDTHRLGARRP